MTPEFLNSTLEHLYERTKEGKQNWKVRRKTAKFKKNPENPVAKTEGKQWVVDECYTAYSCEEHGNEFVMITYENIESLRKEGGRNIVMLPVPNPHYCDLDLVGQDAYAISQK